MENIKELARLRVLKLGFTAITDRGIDTIKELAALEQLDLWR